jgi:type IV pilus assembly protein PilM
MGLFGRNATTVGLDIGSGLIKLVAISHGSGGPVLTKVAFTSVVNDAIVEGEIMDPALVADAIKGLMASAGIKAKKVVCAVGGRDVIIKKIAMDRMKEAEAREVIRWEAEQHVPFDMDNVELDLFMTEVLKGLDWLLKFGYNNLEYIVGGLGGIGVFIFVKFKGANHHNNDLTQLIIEHKDN